MTDYDALTDPLAGIPSSGAVQVVFVERDFTIPSSSKLQGERADSDFAVRPDDDITATPLNIRFRPAAGDSHQGFEAERASVFT